MARWTVGEMVRIEERLEGVLRVRVVVSVYSPQQ